MNATRIYRIDVKPAGEADPLGRRVAGEAASLGLGVGDVASRRVYLIESAADAAAVRGAAMTLLADGVAEIAEFFAPGDPLPAPAGRVEVHLKPGVMDPVAKSCEAALARRGLDVVEVRTGRAFDFAGGGGGGGDADLERVAARVLANGVIESVHLGPFFPQSFAHGRPYQFERVVVPLLGLDDLGLKKLSRDGHLFLSLEEMRAVQTYFEKAGREPTDVELETIAQTWSEHCVHKTLKSAVIVEDEDGRELRRYGNLIRDTIFASTRQIVERRGDDFCLSVFKDNAGVIAFDDDSGVCFKVETHNRPSAIEPYGGAATGIGGVIRDVLGTGLGAKPVANTDVFCVAPPDAGDLPKGVIPPARVLSQIAAGVRDYGNRMGIPTVNGAVHYHPDYVANPLVFCGCVGVLPRGMVEKRVNAGDRIVVVGGRTGRDGIHGATFSSAELTDTHGSEFAHAVQIGNAVTEKQVMDVLLQARDSALFTAVTDCGAGGLSSAVGEMGEALGASVELGRVPLKYAGLRYDEIWISEAQERMVLSVPPEKLAALRKLAGSEGVEATDIGLFGTPARELVLTYDGEEVGRLAMSLLHDGIPMPTRRATVRATPRPQSQISTRNSQVSASLLAKLAEPNVRSKHKIVRQYDHEVLGGSVVKPFVGPLQIGPSDAAVVRPKLDGRRGVAVSCGLAPQVADPYDMAIAAVDEAVRNAVCVGTDLDRLALLDNFCWPGTDSAAAMGTLVRACEACRDAALAFGTPFVSGKDSLHNQFTDKAGGRVIRIPATLLISAIGIVEDVARCATSDLKRPGDGLFLVRPKQASPTLEQRRQIHAFVASQIAGGGVTSSHDVSDGGWLVAAAEMAIGGDLGLDLSQAAVGGAFDEPLTTYLLAGEVGETDVAEVVRLGVVTAERSIKLAEERIALADCTRAWRVSSD